MDPRSAKTVGFFAAMAAVLALFVVLSIFDQPPLVPGDRAHPRHALESSCLDCHGPAGEKPLNAHHTDRRVCLKCHKRT